MEKPFIPVLGGIQPSIFNSFSTEENKDNGFLDRMLLSFPEAVVEEYNDAELEYDTIKWYSESMIRFFQMIKGSLARNVDGDIIPTRIRFSPDAKKEWIRIFNKITLSQNNEDENEYLKSMYPKQKSYIPRFALLIHIFDNHFKEGSSDLDVSRESILKAERLSDYFVLNSRKIKIDSSEISNLKNVSKKAENPEVKLKAIFTNQIPVLTEQK